MSDFTLTKWYLDVVDAAGRSAIAYWSALEWGPLAVGWEGLSLHEPGRPAVHRSALGRGEAPARAGGKILWSSDLLKCRVVCQPFGGPFEARLLEGPGGSVDWRCEAPGGVVTLDAGDGLVVHGAGYAEQLTLTRPPWRLPLSELRWGRWISPVTRRSVVWIDWRGVRPLAIVLADGVARGTGAVADHAISFDDEVLELSEAETLHARTLSDVLRGAGPVVRRLPSSWRTVEDRKTRSRGTRRDARGKEDTGWVIHELVRFP